MLSTAMDLDFDGAKHFGKRIALLEHMLQQAPPGMVLEFGVGDGTTLKILAQAPDRLVVGFDSFAGLPEDWRPGYSAGMFAQPEPPDVPGAQICVGMFSDTLPRFLALTDELIGFVHIDCDLYSSTAAVLELIAPRLVDQAIIVFDEFHGYPGWEDHEYRAWQEFVTKHQIKFDYVAYSVEQVAVRIGVR